MAPITCPACGTETNDMSRTTCPACGAALTPATTASPARPPSRIPVLLLAVATVIVVLAAAALLVPHLQPALSGTGSSGQEQPVPVSPDLTPVPAATPLAVTSAPAPAPVPATAVATKTTMPRSRTTVTPRTTFTVGTPSGTTTSSASAAGVKGSVTTQITLATTQIPGQPPASSFVSANPDAPSLDPTALEARIHELVNAQRRQNGLGDLSSDSFLADIARGHSYDMVLRNYFEHIDPDGKTPKDRGDAAGYPCIRVTGTTYSEGISENLYQGYRGSTYITEQNGTTVTTSWNTQDQIADMTVTGWMNSAGHRANILNTRYQQEGIGIAFSADDRIYVTENFC